MKHLLSAAALAAAVLAAPAYANNYALDPTHTFVVYEIGHFGTTTNRGRFEKKEGTVQFDRAAKSGKVEISFELGSVDTGVDMLDKHLQSADFFDSANHPAAKLSITGGSGNTATADLTIRGTTNPETITDIVITENADGTVKATGKLVFDRQKYNVAWKHYLKDAILADNIELTVELNGKAAQ